MSADPPGSPTNSERVRYWITDVQVAPGSTEPNCKFSARMFVNEELVCNLPAIDSARPFQWRGLLCCNVSPTSSVSIRLCKSVRDRPRYFNYPSFVLSEVDEETGEAILELPEAAWVVTIKFLTPEIAERRFSNEIEKINAIEGTYHSQDPNTTVKYLFKHALKFTSLVAEHLGDRTAKVSFLVYMKVWELLDQQNHLDDTIQAILRGLTCIGDIVEIADQASSSMLSASMNRPKESIEAILNLLENALLYIFNHIAPNDLATASHGQERTNDGYDVEAYLARLKELQESVNASWLPVAVSPVDPIPEEEDLDALLQNDQTDGATRTIDPYEMLRLLRPMDPSGYDPRNACFEGTRESILTRIITWTQNRESKEGLMWISGQVGMGKTSLATSVCQRLDGIQALAGSFFCRYGNPDSSDPLWVINNLVHAMAMRLPAYAREVADAIRNNRQLCNAHLNLRYDNLIKGPFKRLRSLSTRVTYVVVIDAVDECGDCDSREQLLDLLYEMSQLVPWLKIIVTGRPTGDVQEFFEQKCPREPVLRLQDYDACSDIRAYIESQVTRLAKQEHWPTESVDELCKKSSGVFSWAALAVKYIKKSAFPALPRLQKVLSDQRSPVTDHLDGLYTRALATAIDDNEDDIKAAYLRCIGAVFAISEQDTPSTPELQCLLQIASQTDPVTLEQIIKNLAPLLLIIDGRYVRFYHPSFKAFVTDLSRSGPFHVRPDQHKAESATFCIQVMQRDLRFNICNLESSDWLNSEVADLKRRVDSHIGLALRYACTHWIDHFIASPNQVLVEDIKTFMEGPQLMYWIEVLSLLGRMDVATTGVYNLTVLELKYIDDWELVKSWAKDAHRFILSFYDPITASTPHLYVSALAFAPRNSLTAKRMRPYFPNTISIAQGSDSNWHPCIKTTVHPYAIQTLSISPDGEKFITGYPDGSLAMWDMKTGACISKSSAGHRDVVTCVAFSPDGSVVASSSHDTTVRVWDVSRSLQNSNVLSGHSEAVHSVAFSPNGSFIASGSSDKTIRLWDPTTSHPIHGPYVGHSSRITSLAFSPNSKKLASGSWDRTIRVWSLDLAGSRLIGNPLVITGHSDLVTCVVFSPDGSNIVSGSADKTLQLWDAQTGAKSRSDNSPAKHLDTITSVAFSPDSSYISSCSLDGSIQFWSSTTLTAHLQPFGHGSPVNAVAFSPDGCHVLSGSTDTTTRVWDIRSYHKPMAKGPLVGHTAEIYSIAITRNGDYIVSASNDKTVRVWDSQTGTQVGDPFTGHSSSVYCVAISPDGTRILSGSHDNCMKLWDMDTRTIINSYQHNSYIWCIAFSPDGTQITFGTGDSNVYFWDLIGWKMIKNGLPGHSERIYSVAFSPDGTCVASGSGDKKIILWDIESYSRIGGILSGHTSNVRSVVFSPCGTRLVSGGTDHTIRVWDRQTGNTIHTFTGHSGEVLVTAFSPNGSCIASGSIDNTVRLWDIKTGEAIGQPFTAHSGYVWSIRLSPDGNYLISGSSDKTIQIKSITTSCLDIEPEVQPSNSFRWPASPYELHSHPAHPGWVTQDEQSLVFWLPSHYEQPERFLGPNQRTPRSPIGLNYSKFVHGTEWTGVACDSIRNG
ncbi:unnamed protein product, partial [Rhizoctonia solani]